MHPKIDLQPQVFRQHPKSWEPVHVGHFHNILGLVPTFCIVDHHGPCHGSMHELDMQKRTYKKNSSFDVLIVGLPHLRAKRNIQFPHVFLFSYIDNIIYIYIIY